MKCPNCNQEIDSDSIFCEYCGAKIKQLPSSGSRTSSTMDSCSAMSKSKNIAMIVAVALFAISAIIWGEYGLMTGISILISGSLFYWLYSSKVSDGIKIALTFAFALTGIIRAITIHGNTDVFVILLIAEVVIMAFAYYNSTK